MCKCANWLRRDKRIPLAHSFFISKLLYWHIAALTQYPLHISVISVACIVLMCQSFGLFIEIIAQFCNQFTCLPGTLCSRP